MTELVMIEKLLDVSERLHKELEAQIELHPCKSNCPETNYNCPTRYAKVLLGITLVEISEVKAAHSRMLKHG